MAGDILFRARLEDEGATTGLSRLNTAFQQMERRSASGAQALRSVEFGFRELATQAIGVSGPVGKIVEGLLNLGGGSLAVLGVAAGLGLAALSIRALTADARESAEAQKKLAESLDGLGRHGKVIGDMVRIAELQRQLSDPTLGERSKMVWSNLMGPVFGFMGGGKSIMEHRAEIRSEIARLKTEQGREGLGILSPQEQALHTANLGRAQAEARLDMSGILPRRNERGGLDMTGIPVVAASATALAERMRYLELVYNKIPPAVAAETAARERQTAEMNLSTNAIKEARLAGVEANLRRRMVGAPALAITEALRVQELVRQGQPLAVAQDVARQERGAAAQNKTTDILRTQVPAAILSTIQAGQQGGVGAALGTGIQSAAGIAAMLPKIGTVAGLGIGIGGSILGALVSSLFKPKVTIDEFSEQAKAQLRELGGQPLAFSLVIVAPDGTPIRQIQYDLERNQARDAVVRLPLPIAP